jgi:hypothetical protein
MGTDRLLRISSCCSSVRRTLVIRNNQVQIFIKITNAFQIIKSVNKINETSIAFYLKLYKA